MELVCEKYQEKVTAEQAVCRRPNEYCKFRTSCLIHFLSRERAGGRNQGQKEENDRNRQQGRESSKQ